MNTSLRFFCLLAVLALGFYKLQAAPAATNGSAGFQLIADLSDGSRVIGKGGDDAFKFRSDVLGEMKLPLERIRSVECQAKTNSVKLTTSSGDTLAVQFAMKEIRVETAFGNVKLPVALIKNVRVLAMGTAGKARPGRVALWSGEGNGCDSVGGHEAVVSPGITYVSGKVGQCFNFDGQANRIVVPDAPELNFGANQDFSIDGWISPLMPPPDPTTGVMSFIDKRYSPNSRVCQGYAFGLVNGILFFLMSDSIASGGVAWSSSGPDLRDGNMHHVAVTVVRNSTTGGHLYIDGQVVLEFNPTSEPGNLTPTPAQPLRIGNHASDYYSYFKGKIDEVAIYNRALSAAEVQAIFAADQ